MDVVPAKAQEWSVPPFSAEVRDGFLYGRGTLDTKGLGIAHWCAALRAAKAGILRRKLFLVRTRTRRSAEARARNISCGTCRSRSARRAG